MLSSHNSRIY